MITGNFPNLRLRRSRKNSWSRRLIQENSLSANDLILPVFLTEGKNIKQVIKSMPGVYRYSIDKLGLIVNEAIKNKDGYEKIANQIGLLFATNKLLLEELLNNLFYIAESDGTTSDDEIFVLRSILGSSNFRFCKTILSFVKKFFWLDLISFNIIKNHV